MESPSKSSPSLKGFLQTKSNKLVRLNTIERQRNVPEFDVFKRKMTLGKPRINSMKMLDALGKHQRMRKYTEVEEELSSPQSPVRLSVFKQYETKLKLSAESWVIHDMRTNSYKRGWKPNKTCSFNGFCRVLVLYCYCQLLQKNQKLKQLKIKIDNGHLKQSRQKFTKTKRNNSWITKNNKVKHTFAKGSIVYLSDVVKSMIVSGNEDLLEYSLMYCGYLLGRVEKKSTQLYEEQVSFSSNEGEYYAQKFCNYCNLTVFKSLRMPNSTITNNLQVYELISTPNQICQLFIHGFTSDSLFRQIMVLQKYSFTIRFQVGYNYWQDRVIVMKGAKQQRKVEHLCCVVYKGERNYEGLCYNSQLQILMVVEDSKFSMAGLDFDVLERWFVGVTKPIVSKQKVSAISPQKRKKSIFPVLEISKF